MRDRAPAKRFLNFRGDDESLADVRAVTKEIKKLLPKANKMYLDVPSTSRSIDIVQAALHLYFDSLRSAIEDIESRPKQSLNLWPKQKD